MPEGVRLRPVHQADLAELTRFYEDSEASGEFQWFGFRPARARQLERQWADDGLVSTSAGHLVVSVEGDRCAGEVDWRPVGETGALEIGVWLFAEFRGRGVGTAAQRQLVDYLFATSPVHRIQAGTEVDNVAEQRALERAGFRREGVARGLFFRDGKWRDGVMYGLLRDDPRPA